VRLYAEDPAQQFLPQTGSVLLWQPAHLPNVRIDHGMTPQGEVSPFYDPMIAKIIAYGQTRTDAIRLLARAVEDCVLLGVNSNKQFLVNLLRHPELVAGRTSTAFIADHFAHDISLQPASADFESLAIATALYANTTAHNAHTWHTLRIARALSLQWGEQRHSLTVLAQDNGLHITWGEQHDTLDIIEQQPNRLTYRWQGVRRQVAYVQQGDTLYLDRGNGNLIIQHTTYAPPVTADSAGDGQIRAPMDGAVIHVLVAVGDTVCKDQPVLILEAMKIQQQIRANCDGTVGSTLAHMGQQVKKRQVLLTIDAAAPLTTMASSRVM